MPMLDAKSSIVTLLKPLVKNSSVAFAIIWVSKLCSSIMSANVPKETLETKKVSLVLIKI